jgi:hypothetical protein
MNMSLKAILIGFAILFFGVSVVFINLNKRDTFIQERIPSPIPTPPLTLAPIKAGEVSVPIPLEEDIIRVFFELINEKRIPEAISMMSIRVIPDNSVKQAWGAQFNAFKSVKVNKIDAYSKEMWTENVHTYKVILEVSMSKDSINAPIPYYGFDTELNTRWVNIEKDGSGSWKISDIATGP